MHERLKTANQIHCRIGIERNENKTENEEIRSTIGNEKKTREREKRYIIILSMR